MCSLLIAGEDHRFYNHPGVDVVAICRAIWSTYFLGTRQGGSTIAMQLVRTLTHRYERTVLRKIREIILAICITWYVPKRRIPLLYLWCASYGWKMNNFSEACTRLKLNPKTACIQEEAELIARLKYPQPKELNLERMKTIHRRGLHLIQLLNKRGYS
ncbi:MAG: transglycosylase domain-containing protein [Rhodobacteraceae bacterium]|nr:transglycosylase domain-containing protein [Paracoccaceae bacterium]